MLLLTTVASSRDTLFLGLQGLCRPGSSPTSLTFLPSNTPSPGQCSHAPPRLLFLSFYPHLQPLSRSPHSHPPTQLSHRHRRHFKTETHLSPQPAPPPGCPTPANAHPPSHPAAQAGTWAPPASVLAHSTSLHSTQTHPLHPSRSLPWLRALPSPALVTATTSSPTSSPHFFGPL